MWIKALRSVLRDKAGEGVAGGAGDSSAADLVAVRAELATLKAEKAEVARKAADAEKKANLAGGELTKLVDRFETELATERKAKEEALGLLDGHVKKDRQKAMTAAVAAKLGVDADAILVGLLPQTGEDIAPEKLTDALVGKVAEAVRKLAPSLKPKSGTTSAAGTGARDTDTGEMNWTKLGERLAGKA